MNCCEHINSKYFFSPLHVCINKILLLCFLLLASCSNKTELSEETKPYFDLNKYFSQQVDLLNKQHTKLQKQISKDSKTEEKMFNTVNWQNELKPFFDCDINKPSWFHSYFTDTTFAAGEMRVKYLARESSLPVRQLLVSFENNQVKRIQVDKETSNSYYKSKNNYTYTPAEGFSINGSQEVMLARKTNYTIIAKFIK